MVVQAGANVNTAQAYNAVRKFDVMSTQREPRWLGCPYECPQRGESRHCPPWREASFSRLRERIYACSASGMADLPTIIEALEHRWMRAWVGRDLRTLKTLTSRNFRMVVGSKPSVILDAKSWLEAAGGRYLCNSYRFHEIYSRRQGSVTVFASRIEMEAALDGEDWSGEFWVTDLWRKTPVRGSWRLTERILSRPDDKASVPGAIRSLQLWR